MATNRGLASLHSFRGSFLTLILASGLGLLGAGSARAVETVTQTLDSVDAIAPAADLSMQFNKSVAERNSPPYTVAALPSGSPTPTFTACQRSGMQDLYCVQSNDEVWVFNKTATRKLFSCRDANLGLDTKSRNAACTSLTVDLTGSIWIAGRKNNTHSVVNLVEIPAELPENTTCAAIGYPTYSPLASNALETTDFCFLEFTSGRPIILDMMYVDGKDAANFAGPQGTGGRGIIFMEDRKTVSFLPDSVPNPSYAIASGKSAWGLGTKEDLQGVAWYRRDDALSSPDIVLVTTGTGRVLAKNADGSGSVTQVFDAVAERTSTSCSTTIPAQFEIRVSQESRRIYVSDRQCGTVSALRFVNSATTPFAGCPGISSPNFKLCNAKEADGTTDVTLSTAGNEPTGVSVSPGIAINLRDCVTGTCTLVADGGDSNSVGAHLSAVKLDTSSASGLTVFQIKNIPDCRFISVAPCTPEAVVEKIVNTTIKTATGGNQVVTQTLKFLDVSKLMPEEILRLFETTGLPPMLISPQYRGQATNSYYFEGFFGRTEDNVRFRQNFDLLLDIGELVRDGNVGSLGCGGSSTTSRPNLNWDIVTTMSERYVTASQTMKNATTGNGLQHVDMLQNSDCSNPTSGSGTRWSFYPYNLELDPAGVRPNPWKYLLVTPPSYTGPAPDVFGDLLYSLFDDLKLALEETAKVDVDTNTTAPLTTSQYNSLASSLVNVQDKLDKCITAAYDKQSAAAQNCSGLDSQLTNFASAVLGLPMPTGLSSDKANRIGEVRSRALVMKYLLNAQFLPSIPTGGFNQPGT